MKHNTHIYLAMKGIEFPFEYLNNCNDTITNRKIIPYNSKFENLNIFRYKCF